MIPLDLETLRAALATVPRTAIFVYGADLVHRFVAGDPELLADLNLPETMEGLGVGFSSHAASTWDAAVIGARATVEQGITTHLRIRLGDRHYEVHCSPLPGGGGVNVLVDVTRRVSGRP